jgi:hypothetical protein
MIGVTELADPLLRAAGGTRVLRGSTGLGMVVVVVAHGPPIPWGGIIRQTVERGRMRRIRGRKGSGLHGNEGSAAR